MHVAVKWPRRYRLRTTFPGQNRVKEESLRARLVKEAYTGAVDRRTHDAKRIHAKGEAGVYNAKLSSTLRAGLCFFERFLEGVDVVGRVVEDTNRETGLCDMFIANVRYARSVDYPNCTACRGLTLRQALN